MNERQIRALVGVAESDIFLPLFTPNFMADADAVGQWNVARLLGKPFLILLVDGTTIPHEMLRGVRVYETVPLDRDASKPYTAALVEAVSQALVRLRAEISGAPSPPSSAHGPNYAGRFLRRPPPAH